MWASAPQASSSKSSPTSSTMTAVESAAMSKSRSGDKLDKSTAPASFAGPSRSMTPAIGKKAKASAMASEPIPLSRTTTSNSLTHAHNSLRRMATHETGGYTWHDGDEDETDQLHPHEEADDEHGHDSSGSSTDHHGPTHARDEEEKIETPSGPNEDSAPSHDPEKKGKKRKEVVLQDQTNLLPVKQVILVMVGLSCALFCSLLDQTIVVTALPTLGRVFNRADIAAWVGTAYLLTSTAMQPIYGRLSDIFGRKIVLLASIAIFLIGSLAAALAHSMIQLIVFRAIQGLGGGGILTCSMIIISDVVSLRERGKFQGLLGAVIATSNSLGPILGGIFTQSVSWRWCFYINLPLSGLAILIVIFVLPLKRVKGSMMGKLRKLDWYGSVLTLTWAILVLLAFSWAGNQFAWDSPGVLAPLIIGLALLGVFIFVEAKLVALPLVPIRIFKTSTCSAAFATTFFNGAVFYSTLYYLPTYYQVVRGDTAIRSGVLLLPLILVQTVVSFVTGFVQSKTGDYWYNLVAGFSIWTVAVGLLSTIDVNTSMAKLIGFQLLCGIGAGQTFQTSLVAIQASVKREDMATATGIRNFLRMLGGTLGLAICSVLVNNIVRSHLSGKGLSDEMIDTILNSPTVTESLSGTEKSAVLEAYAKGIQACFYFMIPCTAISVLLIVGFVKRVSLRRDDDAQRKAEGKAWIAAREAKKRARKHPHEEEEKVIGNNDAQGGLDVEEDDSDVGHDSSETVASTNHTKGGKPLSALEDGLETSGREEAEAVGVQPSKAEAVRAPKRS